MNNTRTQHTYATEVAITQKQKYNLEQTALTLIPNKPLQSCDGVTDSTESRTFTHSKFSKHTVAIVDGEPKFSATSVAGVLGYSSPSYALKGYSEKPIKLKLKTKNGYAGRETNFISLETLENLISRAPSPEALEFKHWLFNEVNRELGIELVESKILESWSDSNYDNIVDFETDEPTVDGRELHAALGVQTRYNDWFERMCEYGFIDGEDYYSFLSNRSDGLAGKPKTDHKFTISMAKEIAMLQRTDKGKEVRRYFIECEKKLKEKSNAILTKPIPKTYASALRMLADSEDENMLLSERVGELAVENKAQSTEISILAEQVEVWDPRAVLIAIVRCYGSRVYGGRFGYAFSELYRILESKFGIALKKRRNKNGSDTYIDRLKKGEYDKALSAACAMCEKLGVDISHLMRHVSEDMSCKLEEVG